MFGVIRWISLGLSLFALCFSCYSCWFGYRVNGRLAKNNHKLREDNLRLLRLLAEREVEIVRLRKLLEGNNNETDAH